MKLREIRKKNAHNAGFTLLELVIVLAVIAILSAILIPTFTDVISRAKETAARQNCRSVAQQYMLYRLEEGDSSDLGGYLFISGDYAFVLENGELQETEVTEENGIVSIKDGESSFSCEEKSLPSVIAAGDVKVYFVAEKVAYEKCRAALQLANGVDDIDILECVFVYGSYVFHASEGTLQKMEGVTASDGQLQGAAAETYRPDNRFTDVDTDGVVIYTSDASHFEVSGSQAGAQEVPVDPDTTEPDDPDTTEPPVTSEPDEEPEQTEEEAMKLCMATADAVEDALAESGITNYYGNLYVSGEYAFYRLNSSELAAADASFQAGELQSVTIDGLVISDWEKYSAGGGHGVLERAGGGIPHLFKGCGHHGERRPARRLGVRLWRGSVPLHGGRPCGGDRSHGAGRGADGRRRREIRSEEVRSDLHAQGCKRLCPGRPAAIPHTLKGSGRYYIFLFRPLK